MKSKPPAGGHPKGEISRQRIKTKACVLSGQNIEDHFVGAAKMIKNVVRKKLGTKTKVKKNLTKR